MKLQRWWMVVALMAMVQVAMAQMPTTQVQDTVYLANGSPAQGTVLINWSAFETSGGLAVPAGTTSATLSTSGVLSVSLAANAGATPAGSYYTVVYHLSDGSTNREYWVVPVSSTPVTVAMIRSSVLPSSVALQTVTKSYVDQAIAAAIPLAGSSEYVLVSGDTMTGPLVLPGDPTAPLQAADKNYVDENVAGLEAGLAQKVSLLPSASQAVAQPAGTSLGVNSLNGELYASQFQSGTGNNGIANATAGSNCTSGCTLVAEPTYSTSGSYEGWAGDSLSGSSGPGWAFMTFLRDLRGGSDTEVFKDPHNVLRPGLENAHAIVDTRTRSAAQLAAAYGPSTIEYNSMDISQTAMNGGSNLYPQGLYIPYFKSTYSAMAMTGNYYAQGQRSLDSQAVNCFGVGDCLIGSRYVTTSEGWRDNGDEGTHPYDISVTEDPKVPSGICSGGCTTGSTQISIGSLSNTDLGEGRFVIDKNPTKVISTGAIVSSAAGAYPQTLVNFSGTSFPVSTFFLGTGSVSPQTNTMAPGTVTIAIATTGLPSGYSSNTAAAPASTGVACIADSLPSGVVSPSNFEMANYSVVDATHISINFNKPHVYAPTVAMGGLCGYGLEQTVDTVAGSGGTIRQVMPVVGSLSSTSLYYAANNVANTIGVNGTSRFINFSANITSISRSSNVATVTLSTPMTQDLSGTQLMIAGVSDASYNGTYTVTTTSSNSFTYANTGANSSSTGGTASLLTGGFNLYPMAEAISVMNSTTNAVDGGNIQLAPNNVAWATSDAVEMPHYHLGMNTGDTFFVNQVMPRPNYGTHQGSQIQFTGTVGPDVEGMRVINSMAASSYFGNGGTMAAPLAAFASLGAWQNLISAQAGESNLFNITCNSHGCGKWNSNYNLFSLQSNSGAYDTVNYNPVNSNLNVYMGAGDFLFTPTYFSAPAVKAATLTVGAGATVSTSSGTGSELVTTTTATKTSGDCAKWDANGNVVDAGAACGSGSGSSVTLQTNGTNNSLQTALNVLSQSNGNVTATNSSGGNVQLALATAPILTGTNFSGVPYSALSGTVPTWNQNTTGNAATATALAAAPTTCSAGQMFVGVTAAGNASGCVWPTQTKNFTLAIAQSGNVQPAGCSVFGSNAPNYVDVGDGSNSNVLGVPSLVPGASAAQVMSCPMVVPANFGGTITVNFNVSDTVATDSVAMYAKAACTYTPANPTFGTAVSVTPTMSGTAGTVVTTTGISVTPSGTCTTGEPMYLEVYRSTSDGGTGNVYLFNVQAQYTGSL